MIFLKKTIWTTVAICSSAALFMLPRYSRAQNLPIQYDVILDIGHGGVDGGTSSGKVLEKDINLAVGKKLYQQLQKQSFTVGVTRLHDYALSEDSTLHIQSRHMKDLRQRKLIADTMRPKLFVSLHVNWAGRKSLHGPVVIYQPNGKSYALARLLQDHLNRIYDLQKNPVKGSTYFLMKNMDMPSVIVEMGYISHTEDFRMLTQEKFQQEIANAVAAALNEYLMLFPS